MDKKKNQINETYRPVIISQNGDAREKSASVKKMMDAEC
jgi:hypothetical protein